jgi:beta-glucanase (GH16 family)
VLGYYGNNKNSYLKTVSLPFASTSSAFHNYSIHYMPTYFAFYADNVLLGYYNSLLVTNVLPSRPMAVWFYVTAQSTSPKVNDAAYVKSLSYQLMGGVKATCPAAQASTSDKSGATRSAKSWLISSLMSLFALNR